MDTNPSSKETEDQIPKYTDDQTLQEILDIQNKSSKSPDITESPTPEMSEVVSPISSAHPTHLSEVAVSPKLTINSSPQSHSKKNLDVKSDIDLPRSVSRASSVRSLASNVSENESEFGAIKKLAFKSRMLGQIASASFNEKDSYEPLPITDYSLFDEKVDVDSLNINVNPFATNKQYFRPNTPIQVKVTPKRKSRHHIFYPYNYKIKLHHGSYSWSVEPTYKDIKEVHKILAKFVKADIGKSCSDITKSEYKPEWPLFPCEHEYLIHESGAVERSKKLEAYFDKLLRYPPYRDHPDILRLLNVSQLSFINGLGSSKNEGLIYKRFYDNLYTGSFQWMRKICNENFKIIADKRWFVLKDSYIAYISDKFKGDSLGFVMLVDNRFRCDKKIKPGAYYGIQIKNQQRTLILRFKNSQKQNDWYDKIQKMLNGPSKLFRGPLPNDSFAPVRTNQLARWYINAKEYMEGVYNALLSAKEEIFITDWWLCPEIYLKRPMDDLQYRLDKVLLKKSQEGVKIYILLFKELEFALGLLSSRAQCILEQDGKNPNIKVMRHPKNTPPNMLMWSHHEKCVIIDQTIAFLGGIDLCFGRWDDDMHRLVDLGKEDNIQELNEKSEPEAETENITTDNTPQNNNCTLDSALKGMNFLAMNVTSAITSQSIAPISEDSLQKSLNIEGSYEESTRDKFRRKYRRYKKKIKNKLEEYDFSGGDSSSDSGPETELEQAQKDTISITSSLYSVEIPQISKEFYYWQGKDYSNCYKEDFKELESFSKDQFDRKITQRMPWRDEAMCIFGESARDIARHFIQRWNHCKYDLEYQNPVYPYLIPKSTDYKLNMDYKNWFKDDLYRCQTQILRSLDSWSGGITNTEKSILNAYISLIEASEHFIYIENQFFVTTTNPVKDEVKNMVGYALVNRIKKAYDEGKNFKVYVVLPLFPAFDSQNALQAVQFYNLRSIKFGEFSIYKELLRAGVTDPSRFITFHGMRNWTVLMGKLVQEIIYVHSKLMIVDDKYVICGSANINDRSLLGSRDSELACLVKDEELDWAALNGKLVKTGKYASSLRKKIFKLHLGIYYHNPNKISVMDCASNHFFKLWQNTSNQNSRIYEDIFKCLPSNEATTFTTMNEYASQPKLMNTDPNRAKKLLEEHVSGFIVNFPLEFLSEESSFFPSINTKEGIVPVIVWT